MAQCLDTKHAGKGGKVERKEGSSRLCDAVELSRVLCRVIPVLVRVQL